MSGDAGKRHARVPAYNDVLIKQQDRQMVKNWGSV